MKANDYANEATTAAEMYERIRPENQNRYRMGIELARDHLLNAGKILKEIAELIASDERSGLR